MLLKIFGKCTRMIELMIDWSIFNQRGKKWIFVVVVVMRKFTCRRKCHYCCHLFGIEITTWIICNHTQCKCWWERKIFLFCKKILNEKKSKFEMNYNRSFNIQNKHSDDDDDVRKEYEWQNRYENLQSMFQYKLIEDLIFDVSMMMTNRMKDEDENDNHWHIHQYMMTMVYMLNHLCLI